MRWIYLYFADGNTGTHRICSWPSKIYPLSQIKSGTKLGKNICDFKAWSLFSILNQNVETIGILWAAVSLAKQVKCLPLLSIYWSAFRFKISGRMDFLLSQSQFLHISLFPQDSMTSRNFLVLLRETVLMTALVHQLCFSDLEIEKLTWNWYIIWKVEVGGLWVQSHLVLLYLVLHHELRNNNK